MIRAKNPRDWLIVVALLLLADLTMSLVTLWYFAGPGIPEVAQGNNRFGLCFISTPDHLASDARYEGALAAGATWDRWPLYWHWVDEGGYVGAHGESSHDYDSLVAQDLAHGITPVVILLGTPLHHSQDSANGATSPPDSLGEPIFSDGSDIPGPGKSINPANAWASFVFATVERYRPQGLLARQQGWSRRVGVRYWEVWNEPDYYLFWNGTAEEYYRLLEVAYKSIKTADPQATVMLGGLAFYEQRVWFPTLLRQAGGDPSRAYFDVFSFHHYQNVYRSEQLIQQARATLDRFGLEKTPIWITESGVSVWDDYPATAHQVAPDAPLRGTMVEQAAYIIQNSALAFYNGVERYYHFQLHDDCGDGPSSAYGLRQNFSPHACNPAEGKPRPAYAAYQLATEQFREVTPLWRDKQYEQDRVAFYRPGDGSRLMVLWASQGLTATATVSATGQTAHLYWVEPTETLSGTVGFSRTLTLTPTNGLYTLALPAATNRNGAQPGDTTYQIGGQPFILVERDTLPPQTEIQPLPPSSPPTFLVQWRGEDLGSGIAGYDVYVSEDDGPLTLWLANTASSEARYSGQVDHRYSFAVRARDQGGNEAPPPAQPETTTLIVSGPTLAGVVLGPDGKPVANASVAVTGPNTQEKLAANQDGKWLPLPLLPGDYELQASAPGYGSWPALQRIKMTGASTTITVTLASPLNAVTSGDFEGDQVWNVWEWAGQVNLSIDAFDGQAAARLGDGTGEPISCPDGQAGQLWALRQPVKIPPDPAPFLSFLYKISPPQASPDTAWLEVALLIEGQTYYLAAPGEVEPASEWAFAAYDLSTWPGQAATVQFQVIRCSGQPFSVSLDRVSVGSGK